MASSCRAGRLPGKGDIMGNRENAAKEAVDELRSRKSVYAALARIFKVEMSEDLLAYLKQNGFLQVDPEALEDESESARALAEGSTLMQNYLESDEASNLDLDRDYAKCFCGAGSSKFMSAYPFESIYTSEEKLLMQDSRDDVMKWYARHGLGKAASWHDCEDHVAVELEFFTHLIEETAQAIENGEAERAAMLSDEQKAFMEQHIANWIPAFADDVNTHARTDFYKGAALLMKGYVLADCEALLAV